MNKKYLISVCLVILFSSVLFFNSKSCRAANSVITNLNGLSAPGLTDGDTTTGLAGELLELGYLAPPSGDYEFKGWLQQGNFGTGPLGKPLWADGEIRDAISPYAILSPIGKTFVNKIPKPADCKTSSPEIIKMTFTDGGSNLVNLNTPYAKIPENEIFRIVLYAKIPMNYCISPSWGLDTCPPGFYPSARGTGEFEYYEFIGSSGVSTFNLRKAFKLMEEDVNIKPSVEFPVSVEIGYYNVFLCYGSLGEMDSGPDEFENYQFKIGEAEGTDTITAIYTPKVYSISYDKNGGGSAGTIKKQIYGWNANGESFKLYNPGDIRKTGYTFMGWTITKNGNDLIQVYDKSKKGDITLYAKWQFNGFTCVKVPRNIILGKDGKGSFIIQSDIIQGRLTILNVNTTTFQFHRKKVSKLLNAKVTYSNSFMDSNHKSIVGIITLDNILTSGSWYGTFEIRLEYNVDINPVP